MAAQVANFYCAIRTIELRLKIAHENAALQKRSLEITERLFKHGNESELDVQQAKAQYLGTLSTIPATRGQPSPEPERTRRVARPAPRAAARDRRRQGHDPAG